jgi:predicted dehydrogenase
MRMSLTAPSRVRIGIVGAGTVSTGSHLPVLSGMADVVVEWVCDKSLERARAVARSYGIAQAYGTVSECPDVDVVLVATPVGFRREVLPEILARGWHAFCEKPFATTLAEHDAYLAAADRHGVQIGVGQVRRYARPTATARRLLGRRFLGPVRRVAAVEGMRVRSTGKGTDWYRADPTAGGGVLMETGSHLVDQALYILDATSVSVRDRSARIHLGVELASSVVAGVGTRPDGVVECGVEVSMLDDLCNGIFVEFESSVLKVGLGFEDGLSLVSKTGDALCEFATREGAATPLEGFFLEWTDFLRQCRTGEGSVIAAATARNTTALIEACAEPRKAPVPMDAGLRWA